MEKKIVVPEEMLKSAIDGTWTQTHGNARPACSPRVQADIENNIKATVEAALRWLSENPIEPTQKQSRKLYADVPQGLLVDEVPSWYAIVWQRRMFLAPDLEVPEDVDDLLWPVGCHTSVETVEQINNKRIIEAYRRGKEAK